MPYPKQYQPGKIDPDNPDAVKPGATVAPQAPTAPQVIGPQGGAPTVRSFGDGVLDDMSQNTNTPWGDTTAPAPTREVEIDNPNQLWTLNDIKAKNPEITQQIKDLLWQRYQGASNAERNSPFFQGVRQNPELAAASIVRRALHNMQRSSRWINGEETPTLDQAAQDALENNQLRRWLTWTRNGGRMPR